MRVTSLRISRFRSFVDSGPIELSGINVVVGKNNAGKSSVLRAIHHLQTGSGDAMADVRAGERTSQIEICVDRLGTISAWGIDSASSARMHITIASEDRRAGSFSLEVSTAETNYGAKPQLPNQEPYNYIVPFLSKRKTSTYSEDIREQMVRSVSTDMSNLAAKLSRVGSPQFPHYSQYEKTCREILGFVVAAVPAANGQRPGIYLPSQETIPIDQMGDGVANIVYMLASLATSREKLFLIEEPENDLHPTALRSLLDLIVESSEYNQFVVSTHSNIVVRHLCSKTNSTLYRVSSTDGGLPTSSSIELVPPSAKARFEVLEELGYELSDFDIWRGWIFLEESSAEQLIRDYLVPMFAPSLTRVRTVSVRGTSSIEPHFRDFHRLVLFTHLEPVYQGKAWVLVDGEPSGRAVVDRLRRQYTSWDESHFRTFEQAHFERYYPAEFSSDVNEVLMIEDRERRRSEKAILLQKVVEWLDEDRERARSALQASAREVIEVLIEIERKIAV